MDNDLINAGAILSHMIESGIPRRRAIKLLRKELASGELPVYALNSLTGGFEQIPPIAFRKGNEEMLAKYKQTEQ